MTEAPARPSPPESIDHAAYPELVREDRVHSRLYTDPEIFAEELEKIWYSTWVFVGHESEIASPNDYVRKKLGPQDIIMTRDRHGVVHLLVNRCAHRANLVCDDPQGNSSSFRCPYHGWTFKNDGELLGYPYNKGYGGKGQLTTGLGKLRCASYQGFVFGTFATDGPSLEEHLGAATQVIDRLVELSPTGKIRLDAGWLRHKTRANWKLLTENETDGYHPQFVHGSVFSVTGSHIGELYSDASTAVTRDLGNGHSENDLRPEFREFNEPMKWFGTSVDRFPDYVAAIEERLGDEAQRALVEGAPHVMIFPNLFIAEIQVFMIQPVAVDECVQYSTAVQFEGAPDAMNRRMVSQSLGSVGPAGMLLADDTEMYERNQRGLKNREPEWVQISRGLVRERIDEDGHRIGHANDETGMRGFWRHWVSLMTGKDQD